MVKQKKVEGVSSQLEVSLGEFFLKKMPDLPKNIKEFIVRFGPWLILISLITSFRSIFYLFGFGGMMSGYGRYGYAYGFGMTWWISIVSMVLMAIALPGLFKRQMFAWKLMFYSTLVMAVYYVVTLSLGGLLIGTGISMYILFQIKSLYK